MIKIINIRDYSAGVEKAMVRTRQSFQGFRRSI